MGNDVLFGTDGIRGKFGEWPLTAPVIFNIGYAVAEFFGRAKNKKQKLKILIGTDTRASGKAIERCLAQGFIQAKAEVYSAGVVPTPGLAFLTNVLDVDLGVMISASHNPADDNGIKFFKHNGYKLREKEEREIEKIILHSLNHSQIKHKERALKLKKISAQAYVKHLLKSVSGLSLEGMKIAIDCANGALSKYAEKVFRALGARVIQIHACPDGKNINLHCGSLHPDQVSALTLKAQADIGFSFDGDADRVIVCDERGDIRDGDYVMAAVAGGFSRQSRLAANTVVATSMSNFGLEKYLEKINVKLVRADVGDKYVLEEIIKRKANFGGEQSGHLIFLDYATTGDGLLSALMILKLMADSKKKASKLAPGFRKYPQLLVNIKVREKKDFQEMPLVAAQIKTAEQKLKGNGRLVIRYSGTEKLARVMVEGDSKSAIKKIAEAIALEIKKEIGILS